MRLLGSDFVFVTWALWVVTMLLVVLVWATWPKRRPQEPVAAAKHRTWRLRSTRRADRRYAVEYRTELLASTTLVVPDGPTAPASHTGWTRSIEVIARGGDD